MQMQVTGGFQQLTMDQFHDILESSEILETMDLGSTLLYKVRTAANERATLVGTAGEKYGRIF